MVSERAFAPPVAEQLAVRIADIIKVGLPEDEIKALLEKYLVPNNCKIIDPPK